MFFWLGASRAKRVGEHFRLGTPYKLVAKVDEKVRNAKMYVVHSHFAQICE